VGILGESDVSEFKWHKLKTAKYRFCAEKILDALFGALQSFDARVDVVIWDICDSRHRIADRDDVANYGRMYFHLQSQVMKRRPKGSEWCLYPDEQVEIDWKTVNQCLSAVGRHRQYIDSPLFGGFFADRYYQIQELCPVESHRTPCCQVADLFAGLSVFSKIHYDQYEKWIEKDIPSLQLYREEEIETTNREENRFRVLKDFNAECKTRKLGVSLKTRRCLCTPDPNNRLNFWHYEPQHELDRAPQRGDRQ
jgi:hypothetical protein